MASAAMRPIYTRIEKYVRERCPNPKMDLVQVELDSLLSTAGDGGAAYRKLVEALSPTFIKIVNESHLHAGHSGNPGGGPDAETHFRWVRRKTPPPLPPRSWAAAIAAQAGACETVSRRPPPCAGFHRPRKQSRRVPRGHCTPQCMLHASTDTVSVR
jgi:hypothetical protein